MKKVTKLTGIYEVNPESKKIAFFWIVDEGKWKETSDFLNELD